MTVIRMYVSRPFVFPGPVVADAVAIIEADLAKHFGGFTIIPHARGVWIAPDGERHVDVVDVYDIMVDDTTSTLVMDDFARRFAYAYGQESIPYAALRSENHFVTKERGVGYNSKGQERIEDIHK